APGRPVSESAQKREKGGAFPRPGAGPLHFLGGGADLLAFKRRSACAWSRRPEAGDGLVGQAPSAQPEQLVSQQLAAIHAEQPAARAAQPDTPVSPAGEQLLRPVRLAPPAAVRPPGEVAPRGDGGPDHRVRTAGPFEQIDVPAPLPG